MLVGVNTISLRPGHGGGSERYLRRVLDKMRELQSDTKFVIFTDPDNHDSFEGWERARCGGASRLGSFRDGGGQLDQAAKRAAVDVLFSPLATAPVKCSVPQVSYALDVRDWDDDAPGPRRKDVPKLKTAKKMCANAAALVAPSRFTQRKLLELLDVPLNKTIVAPLGVDEAFSQPQPCMVEQPFLLTVGDTHEFKNIPRLRQAFGLMKDEFPHNLVVVGRPAEGEPEDWGQRVFRIDHCSTRNLAGLYQHCDIYIQASLHEGSGVTVLEAMRGGAPVVTSRTGGITEVVGDVPVFFNAESVKSIMGAIRRTLEEYPQERRNRTATGKQIAAQYTWETCAWKTIAAFRRA